MVRPLEQEGREPGGADLDDLLREVLARVGDVLDSQARMKLLLDAVVFLAADLSLDSVLHRIVRATSELADARYVALGVLGSGPDRRLESFITHGISEEQRARIGDLPRGHGILGHIIDRPEPLRLHDLASHPASYGFPPDHPPMSSFLGVPIRIRGKVFGNLYLTEKRGGGDFTEQDEAIVVALAAAVGVVIENARLYAEAARREQWLRATAEITTALLGEAGPDEALRVVADRAREVAGADHSTVSLLRGDELRVQVRSGMPRRPEQPVVYPVSGSVAGLAVTSGEPVVVEDLASDPRGLATAMGDLARDIGPMAVVPLATPRGVVGALTLAWRPEHRRSFEGLDVDLPQRFAEQAALALEVSRARRDQERLVVFEERDRIGRDLHDLVIQRLFAIGLQLQNTARVVDHTAASARIERAVDDIDATIADLRRTIFALNQQQLGDVATAVDELVDRASHGLGFRPHLQVVGPVDRLAGEVGSHLLAVLGEALSNAVRHSGASRVEVTVAVDERVSLRVSDDGRGIDPGSGRESGLANMRERAERLDGWCRVDSGPGQGTTIEWAVPLATALGA